LAKVGQGGSFSCGSGGTGVGCSSQPTACANGSDSLGIGCQYAQANGFTPGGKNGRQNVLVQAGVSNTAPTVPGVKVKYWVVYTVTEVVPQLFSAVLGNKMGTVSVRATSAVVGSSGPCILVLDPAAQNAFVASGSANVNATCGIAVNSTDSKAMVTSGSACVTGTFIRVTGSNVNSSSCPPQPTPKTGVNPTADPLANQPAPSFSSCDHTNFTLSNTTASLSPGTYCNGITIQSNVTATFGSGQYILLGGGLTVSSASSSITGSNVSFYNTANATYSYKPITISGGAQATLSAPMDGAMAGILFFQDRTISSSSKNTVSGGSTTTLTGTLYFPTTPLVYSGGSSANTNAVTLISDTLEFSGPSWIADQSSNGGGPAGMTATIIE
jgi:hypothetical protein